MECVKLQLFEADAIYTTLQFELLIESYRPVKRIKKGIM